MNKIVNSLAYKLEDIFFNDICLENSKKYERYWLGLDGYALNSVFCTKGKSMSVVLLKLLEPT